MFQVSITVHVYDIRWLIMIQLSCWQRIANIYLKKYPFPNFEVYLSKAKLCLRYLFYCKLSWHLFYCKFSDENIETCDFGNDPKKRNKNSDLSKFNSFNCIIKLFDLTHLRRHHKWLLRSPCRPYSISFFSLGCIKGQA